MELRIYQLLSIHYVHHDSCQQSDGKKMTFPLIMGYEKDIIKILTELDILNNLFVNFILFL